MNTRNITRNLLRMLLFVTGTVSGQDGYVRCWQSFLRLGFDPLNFLNYPTYLRSTSTLHSAQLGDYTGSDDIEEFMRFTGSKYFSSVINVDSKITFVQVPGTENICDFRLMFEYYIATNPLYTEYQTYTVLTMFRISYNPIEKYITNWNIYYTAEYLDFVFGKVLAGPNTLNYVCSVAGLTCQGIIPPYSNCQAQLDMLNATEGELKWVDGNTTGCRAVHAILAEVNPNNHCQHIAWNPVSDPKGMKVCHESRRSTVQSLFTRNDIAEFRKYARRRDYKPQLGYKVL